MWVCGRGTLSAWSCLDGVVAPRFSPGSRIPLATTTNRSSHHFIILRKLSSSRPNCPSHTNSGIAVVSLSLAPTSTCQPTAAFFCQVPISFCLDREYSARKGGFLPSCPAHKQRRQRRGRLASQTEPCGMDFAANTLFRNLRLRSPHSGKQQSFQPFGGLSLRRAQSRLAQLLNTALARKPRTQPRLST